MKIVAVIQARMNSRRLPGKVLRDLAGRPMLAYLVERVERCRNLDGMILATSDATTDDPVAEFATRQGMLLFRGDLEDVARRFIDAARSVGADAVVRLNGDSPLLDSAVIETGVRMFRDGEVDLVTNVAPRSYPPGCSVEVVRTAALERVYDHMSAEDREHVTRALYRDPCVTRVNFSHHADLSRYRLTVDEEADFGRVRRIIQAMERPHQEYSVDDVIALGLLCGALG